MRIDGNKFISECTTYDFKRDVEEKKVRSWLKSVSAFANTEGGTLYFGVDDDANIVGVDNPQHKWIHDKCRASVCRYLSDKAVQTVLHEMGRH